MARALNIAQQLDALNRERREIESGMGKQAMILLESIDANDAAPGIALFNESWHEGVVGILASRIKEKLHRPVFAFAPVKVASSRVQAVQFLACTCAMR